MNIAQQFITTRGIKFRIERNGKIVSTSLGLPNHETSTKKPYIGMPQNADVNIGDWLINPSDERFYVEDKISDYAFGEFQQYKLFYLTESQLKKQSMNSTSTIFNIGSATGSVIGTQSVVNMNYQTTMQQLRDHISSNDSPDKEQLEKLISILEMITNDDVPAQKGILAKFSSVMERNSWITSSIASALISWLTTQPL